jgi:hypothetical protein
MDRLRSKLLVVLEEQQAAALADIRGDALKAEWGQQIRNYVFHPYKLVKDPRTGESRFWGWRCRWGVLLVSCRVLRLAFDCIRREWSTVTEWPLMLGLYRFAS